MAVRIRRIKSNQDQIKPGLTPSEEDTYGRLKTLKGPRRDLESPTLWGKMMHERKARIRGLAETIPQDDEPGVINIGPGMGHGDGRVRIVGKRIYLPNFVIQFIRNKTAVNDFYNPYEATFRIPRNLTKNDLRSYLFFVYGVKTTYIRTDNFIAPFKRQGRLRTKVRAPYGTFKRAVVGLVDPFYPPGMLEDMSKKERKDMKKNIWENFYISQRATMRERQIQQMRQPFTALNDKKNPYVEGLATSRAKIMQKVLERRKEREKMIQKKVEELMKKDPIRLQV
jgi:large subunit ribosomal protein L23